ncbi:hypothetical protein L2E82_11251 [Cichorium intybus]|uniref:Uncharacterized protein n=1 Tax=Cichorium intybus TaxID=13427 RepID=A0ACB9GES5_CICIN|nr:hypothetical protein L2E82_11251 [Cichorium intybus]
MKSSSSSSRISLEQFVSKMNPLIDMEKFNKRTYLKILKPGFVETTLTVGLFFLLVQVKDFGSGIKQQDIPHIFKKFSEPRSATNRISGGAGLGLAICKRSYMNRERRVGEGYNGRIPCKTWSLQLPK